MNNFSKSSTTREHLSAVYCCKQCEQPIFSTLHEYHNGITHLSFWGILPNVRITSIKYLENRVSLHCGLCASHLGYSSEDSITPTGVGYNIEVSTLSLKER